MTKNSCNEKLGELNNGLREYLVDGKKISIEDWNTIVAPKLERLGMLIDEINITARTFRLPKNYFE